MPGVPGDAGATAGAGGTTNDPNAITVTFRGVSLDHVKDAANKELAYAVQRELKECPLLDPLKTELTADQIRLDETNLTFSFVMTLSRKVKESDKVKAAPAPQDPNAPVDPNAPAPTTPAP
jgi:hypothetical protein